MWRRPVVGLTEVGVHIRLNRATPRAVEVIEHNIRMRDLDVGADVVVQVVADRKVDPLIRRNHRSAVQTRALHNIQLIGGANTTAEQELRGAQGSCGDNDTAGPGCEIDGARTPGIVLALEFDAGDVSAFADDSSGSGVHPEVELGTRNRGLEVRPKWSVALGILDVEGRVGVGAVLLFWGVVCYDVFEAGCVEAFCDAVKALLEVELAVHGGVVVLDLGQWYSRL
jgi:hypothetical protein